MEGLIPESTAVDAASARRSTPELRTWIWLWSPLVLVAGYVIARLVSPEFFDRWIDVKEGAIEWATVVILFPAVWAGFRALRQRRKLPSRWLGGWLLLMTLGSAYYAGEEASWGQHLFHWESPEAIKQINKQDETNLHNIVGWFNEKPRALLELFVLIGGIVMVLRLGRHRTADDWRTWFWPGWVCLPVACVAIGIRIPDRMEKYLDIGRDDPTFGAIFNMPVAEAQEFFFAMFLMIYLVSFRARLDRAPEPAAPPPA